MSEDVVQKTWQIIWRRAVDFDPRCELPSIWIGTIIRHQSIDALRSRCLRHQRTESAFDRRNDDHVAPGGDTAAIAHERQQLINLVVEMLSAAELNIITMAFWNGLSMSEIAGSFEVPLGTVKTRIRRAKIKLRLALVRLRRSYEIVDQLGHFRPSFPVKIRRTSRSPAAPNNRLAVGPCNLFGLSVLDS